MTPELRRVTVSGMTPVAGTQTMLTMTPTTNSISSTVAPTNINDNKVTGNNLNVGNVIIVNDHNKEELLFQPKPFKADNYKVTGFSHQTTAQGHSYR